ncbi:MAG: selenocysteine-specific translation elongation factor [Actinomycetota bacterium]
MYVLATAGHVDHGKSTLIERLTGIDPDRLEEEKRRGLTIDLGFAWLTLPSGHEVGIVDVPGHERFVANMLAGAGSIGATIFVVAANEGWMPQSEEHLAILDLLGVRGGVVALTKSDLVDEQELNATTEAVSGRLDGTVLEGAAIVPLAATTGAGIETFLAELDRMFDRAPPAPDLERPRLYVDRSFSIKGAGTVVTGTLTGGPLRIEDEIEVLPAGATGRVRSIQTHKRRRDEARPGSRVALNIAGIDRHEIARGDAVVRAGQWRTTSTLDASVRAIRSLDHVVGSRGAYKLHLGTAEVDARVRLLDARELRAGEEGYARITLSGPIVADAFDRFVLRDTSRARTVAGGLVLDAQPVRRRLGAVDAAKRVEELITRRAAGHDGLAAAIVEERGVVAAEELALLVGASPRIGPVTGYATSSAWLDGATAALTGALGDHHRANPLERGMPREPARAAAGIQDAKLFAALVDAIPDVVAEGTLLRLASHRVTLDPEQLVARDRLVGALEEAGLAPPPLSELAERHGTALVVALIEGGELVRFSPELALTRDRYERTKETIARTIRAEGPLTVSRLREVLGTSRKYLVPLLEHLDADGFTKRSGDLRSLSATDGG